MTGSLEAGRWERVLHIPEIAAETQGFDLVVSDTSFSFPFLMRGEPRLEARCASLTLCGYVCGFNASARIAEMVCYTLSVRFGIVMPGNCADLYIVCNTCLPMTCMGRFRVGTAPAVDR